MNAQRPAGRRYQLDVHGASGTGFAGDYVLKSSAPAKKYTPVYGNNHLTTVRILPVRNPDDPSKWEDFLIDFGHGPTPGDWIRSYQVARLGDGDASVSFITHDPADGNAFDTLTSPAWVLFNAVQRRINAKTDPGGWAGYMNGGADRGAALSKPKNAYFCQCVIFQHKEGIRVPPIGLEDDGQVVVLQFSKAVGDALLRQVAGTNPIDVVSLNAGAFVTFFTKKDGDPRQRQAQGQITNFQQAGPRQSGPPEIGFDVYVEQNFVRERYNFGPDLSQYESLIASKTQSWDNLINIPDPVQQAHWLAERFPADMIMYAFEGHPEWIPESVYVKAQAKLATTLSAPAGYPSAFGGNPAAFGAPVASGFIQPAFVGQPANMGTAGFHAPPVTQTMPAQPGAAPWMQPGSTAPQGAFAPAGAPQQTFGQMPTATQTPGMTFAQTPGQTFGQPLQNAANPIPPSSFGGVPAAQLQPTFGTPPTTAPQQQPQFMPQQLPNSTLPLGAPAAQFGAPPAAAGGLAFGAMPPAASPEDVQRQLAAIRAAGGRQ